jgi:hypothetical protein
MIPGTILVTGATGGKPGRLTDQLNFFGELAGKIPNTATGTGNAQSLKSWRLLPRFSE